MSVFQDIDDEIYVRVKTEVYRDTVVNFMLDCSTVGVVYTPMAVGLENRLYLQDSPEQHTCDDSHGIPQRFEFPDAELETIITRFNDFMSAKASRDAIEEAARIAEELAAEAEAAALAASTVI
jgi:hypothetical protein